MGAKKTLDWLTPENIQFPEDVVILRRGEEPPREGLVARCYEDGQLAFLGFYLQGSCDHSWVLILKQGIEQGEARQGSPGTADSEYYRDGTWERYDAWSDNSKPKAEDYQVWVCRWLTRIVNNAISITERNKEGIEIRKKIEESGKRSVFKVIK